MRGSALRKLYRDTSGANVRLRCYPMFMLDQRERHGLLYRVQLDEF
jgi:hypothetical protein